jgi:hypothetical protein
MAANQKLTYTIAMRRIENVRQEGAMLYLDFADGFMMQVILAGATSSVMIRDKNRKLEYAD